MQKKAESPGRDETQNDELSFKAMRTKMLRTYLFTIIVPPPSLSDPQRFVTFWST